MKKKEKKNTSCGMKDELKEDSSSRSKKREGDEEAKEKEKEKEGQPQDVGGFEEDSGMITQSSQNTEPMEIGKEEAKNDGREKGGSKNEMAGATGPKIAWDPNAPVHKDQPAAHTGITFLIPHLAEDRRDPRQGLGEKKTSPGRKEKEQEQQRSYDNKSRSSGQEDREKQKPPNEVNEQGNEEATKEGEEEDMDLNDSFRMTNPELGMAAAESTQQKEVKASSAREEGNGKEEAAKRKRNENKEEEEMTGVEDATTQGSSWDELPFAAIPSKGHDLSFSDAHNSTEIENTQYGENGKEEENGRVAQQKLTNEEEFTSTQTPTGYINPGQGNNDSVIEEIQNLFGGFDSASGQPTPPAPAVINEQVEHGATDGYGTCTQESEWENYQKSQQSRSPPQAGKEEAVQAQKIDIGEKLFGPMPGRKKKEEEGKIQSQAESEVSTREREKNKEAQEQTIKEKEEKKKKKSASKTKSKKTTAQLHEDEQQQMQQQNLQQGRKTAVAQKGKEEEETDKNNNSSTNDVMNRKKEEEMAENKDRGELQNNNTSSDRKQASLPSNPIPKNKTTTVLRCPMPPLSALLNVAAGMQGKAGE